MNCVVCSVWLVVGQVSIGDVVVAIVGRVRGCAEHGGGSRSLESEVEVGIGRRSGKSETEVGVGGRGRKSEWEVGVGSGSRSRKSELCEVVRIQSWKWSSNSNFKD